MNRSEEVCTHCFGYVKVCFNNSTCFNIFAILTSILFKKNFSVHVCILFIQRIVYTGIFVHILKSVSVHLNEESGQEQADLRTEMERDRESLDRSKFFSVFCHGMN